MFDGSVDLIFLCVLCLLACSMPNKYFCSSILLFCLSVLLFLTSLVCLHLIKLLTSWLILFSVETFLKNNLNFLPLNLFHSSSLAKRCFCHCQI